MSDFEEISTFITKYALRSVFIYLYLISFSETHSSFSIETVELY